MASGNTNRRLISDREPLIPIVKNMFCLLEFTEGNQSWLQQLFTENDNWMEYIFDNRYKRDRLKFYVTQER